MAWVSISNTAIDQDSPITVSLMTALRDNPAAIANGDAGAPKVQTAGINDAAVTTAKIADLAVSNGKLGSGCITIGKFAAPAASSAYTLYYQYIDGDTGSSATITKVITRSGGYRVRVTGDSSSSTRIYINGTLTYTLSTYTTSVEQTQDLDLSAGDTIAINPISVGPGEYVRVRVSCSQPFPFFLLDE